MLQLNCQVNREDILDLVRRMIAVCLDPAMVHTLDVLAEAMGKNRSVIMREALLRWNKH